MSAARWPAGRPVLVMFAPLCSIDALRSNAKFSSSKSTASLTTDAKWGFGAMTAVELGLADYAGIAVGLHYLQRRFQISGGAVDWTRTIPTLFVPVEARFYLAKVISVGAGGFAAAAATA